MIIRSPVPECFFETSTIVSSTVTVRRRKLMCRGGRAMSSPSACPSRLLLRPAVCDAQGSQRSGERTHPGLASWYAADDLGQLRVLARIDQDQLVPNGSRKDRVRHDVILPH